VLIRYGRFSRVFHEGIEFGSGMTDWSSWRSLDRISGCKRIWHMATVRPSVRDLAAKG
jgi:hypothetical protein